MAHQVRRIVTGFGPDGRSRVTFDSAAGNVLPIAGWEGAFVTELWTTEEMPVDNEGDADRGARPIRHDPTPGGTIFRVVEIPPDANGGIDVDAAFESLGSHNKPSEEDSKTHGSMHYTDSIDYLIVIRGEMAMVMEDGETILRPGDCIVQRATKHAWVNRGTEPCVIAAILVDAKPMG